MISVKNTFITITSPDSMQHEITRKKRNSLPTSTVSLTSFNLSSSEYNLDSSPSTASPSTQCSSIKYEPCFFPPGQRVTGRIFNTQEDAAFVVPRLTTSSTINVDQNREWCDKTSNSALILPSIGSQLHYIGECNPCAFLHKPRGCMEGYDCEFCHCCDKNDYITRKKIRAKKGKEIKRQAKLALG